MKSTQTYLNKIEELKELIKEADYILIGAGSGLSTASGYIYSGERFKKYFHDYELKYKFHDMYTGGFYEYKTLEEYWAYWSRYVYINRYTSPEKQTYNDLYDLVKDKDYFVITTNVDHCFQRAGFAKERLFYTQGDYGLFQCSVPCNNITYDNETIIKEMVEKQKDMRIPSELIPLCPVCGKPMIMNLRCDDKFVQDDGWHKACRRYEDFLKKSINKKILFLELGVGYNTPAIIKYPFWRMTLNNKNASYVCINTDIPYIPREIEEKSLCFTNDINDVLEKLNSLNRHLN